MRTEGKTNESLGYKGCLIEREARSVTYVELF